MVLVICKSMSILLDETEENAKSNLPISSSLPQFQTRRSILKVNICKSINSSDAKNRTKKRKRVKFADGIVEKRMRRINSNSPKKTSSGLFKVKIKNSKKDKEYEKNNKTCSWFIF